MFERCDLGIRRFRTSDLNALRGLISNTIDACYPYIYSQDAIRFYKDWHCDESILKDADEGYTVVLEKYSRVIATGTFAGDEIKRVFVETIFQNNGFGEIVMQELEEKARTEGIDIVKLDATILSREFYDLLGYSVLKKTFVDVGNDKKLDYYKMQKRLKIKKKADLCRQIKK